MSTDSRGGVAPRLLRLARDWRLQAVLAAIALGLAVAVGVAIGRRPPARTAGVGVPGLMPEAFPINDSWRAAAAADDVGYLSCFAREAREQLKAKRARQGRDAFRKELRAVADAALGFEWGPPQPAPEGGLRFPVTVFHRDDVELFDYVVAKVDGGWRIRAVESRGRQAASPPYSERLGPPTGSGGQK